MSFPVQSGASVVKSAMRLSTGNPRQIRFCNSWNAGSISTAIAWLRRMACSEKNADRKAPVPADGSSISTGPDPSSNGAVSLAMSRARLDGVANWPRERLASMLLVASMRVCSSIRSFSSASMFTVQESPCRLCGVPKSNQSPPLLHIQDMLHRNIRTRKECIGWSCRIDGAIAPFSWPLLSCAC